MATVTVGGLPYELLNPDDLSFGDQRKLKRYTGGMGLSDIVRGLQGEMDPDAWFGLILLSVQQKNPTFTAEDLERLNMVEIVVSTIPDVEPEADPDPPALAPAAPARRRNGSQSTSASAETPAASGVLA